jgi:hypothetical protein
MIFSFRARLWGDRGAPPDGLFIARDHFRLKVSGKGSSSLRHTSRSAPPFRSVPHDNNPGPNLATVAEKYLRARNDVCARPPGIGQTLTRDRAA